MHHMIPLVDAEALATDLEPPGLTCELIEQTTDSTLDVVFRDTRIGMCYKFTAQLATNESGNTTYGFASKLVEGEEYVPVEPVVRQTQTVTRWVPIEPVEPAAAEEAEQL